MSAAHCQCRCIWSFVVNRHFWLVSQQQNVAVVVSCNRQKCVDDFICRKMWHRNLIMSLYLAVPRRQRGNILWGRNNGLWHRDIGLTSSHIHLDRLSCHHHGTISWYWIGMDGTMGQLAHFLRLYFHNSYKSYIGCSKYFLRFS